MADPVVVPVTETEEQKKAREARDQLSLRDVNSLWENFTGAIGTIFNWGVPALIFGGLLLAAAKPISELIRVVAGDEWADKFLDFTEYAKDKINTSIGKEIFTVDKARLEDAARREATPEKVQGALVANQVPQEIAQAIAPDQQAVGEVLDFMKQQGIAPTEANRMLEPANLTAFARTHPQTMQRVVRALPQATAAGAAQIPAALKEPFKQLLGDAQSRSALLANPQHALWMREAFMKFGGTPAQFDSIVQLDAKEPQIVSEALTQIFDGVAPSVAMQTTLKSGAPQTPEGKAALEQIAYDGIKSNAALGPVIAILEARDATFAEALKAIDPKNLEGEALKLITAKPERIAALKDLTDAQMTTALAALNIQGDLAGLLTNKQSRDSGIDMLTKLAATNSAGNNELGAFLSTVTSAPDAASRTNAFIQYIAAKPERIAVLKDVSDTQFATIMVATGIPIDLNTGVLLNHKPTRDAAIDMLGKLATTNSEGKNELGTMLAGVAGAQNQLASLGALAGYVQGNTERLGALHDFKLALERISSGRGDDLKPAYQGVIGLLGGLVGNAPQAAQIASAGEKLPDALKPVLEDTMLHGPAYISTIMSSDADRKFLGAETDGRKNLYHLGDALASMDASKFGANGNILRMLTTKTQDGRYPNLDAFMQMNATIDNHTGLTKEKAEGIPRPHEVTSETSQSTQTMVAHEQMADQINEQMVGVFLAMANGSIRQKGPDNGVNTQYEVTALGKTYNVTGVGIAEYFNTLTKDITNPMDPGSPKQTVGAMRDFLNAMDVSKLDPLQQNALLTLKNHFWVDANENGLVEEEEGAANFLYDPLMAHRLLATAATGESQFNGGILASGSALLNFVSFGYAGQNREWNDGEHVEAIAEALTKAGVGKTQEAEASAPDVVRLALAGGIPTGVGGILSK